MRRRHDKVTMEEEAEEEWDTVDKNDRRERLR